MFLPMATETQAIFVHDKLMSMESLFVVAAAINSMEKGSITNIRTAGFWILFPSRVPLLEFLLFCGLTDSKRVRSGCSDFKGSRRQ